MIKTAIVILNWNGEHYLKEFLPILIQHTPKKETAIYVVDNGSADNSLFLLKTEFPEVKLIVFKKNYGFTEGYNKALKQIEAEYFLLLNSDVEVTKNWLQPLIDILDKNTNVACCMPKILSYDNKKAFEYAGAGGGFIDSLGYPFCRGRILSEIEEDKEQYNDTPGNFWTSGACMLIRAKLFRQAGGFDSNFFAHMEEIDLCWKLKNMGYKVLFASQSKVYHVGGGTMPNNSPHKLFLNFRNGLALLHKNLPSEVFYKTICLRMILDVMAAIVFLFTFQFGFFMAVLKAHWSYYKWLPYLKKRRKLLLKHSVLTKHKEIYKGSIVFDFFVKRKRKFSALNFGNVLSTGRK